MKTARLLWIASLIAMVCGGVMLAYVGVHGWWALTLPIAFCLGLLMMCFVVGRTFDR